MRYFYILLEFREAKPKDKQIIQVKFVIRRKINCFLFGYERGRYPTRNGSRTNGNWSKFNQYTGLRCKDIGKPPLFVPIKFFEANICIDK